MAKSEPPPPDAERAYQEHMAQGRQIFPTAKHAFLAGWQAREQEIAELRWALGWALEALGGDHPDFTGAWADWDRARAALAAQPRGEGVERG